jgi:hypothetical protein
MTMPIDKKPLARPRNIALAAMLIVLLVVGGFAWSLANTAGMLPWQEDPTPISNSITPFAGTGIELPTTPPKRTPTPVPTSAASSPATPGTR